MVPSLCECYLSKRWIASDLFLDKPFYEAACKNGIIVRERMPTIEWDGATDLITASAWIIEDKGTHASYD